MSIELEGYEFQKDWSGRGERRVRDYLLIPAFFFGAVGSGLFLVSALFNYLPGLWISLIITLVGYGIPHLFFLGRIERFWRASLRPQSSWISRGFIFYGLFMFFGFCYSAYPQYLNYLMSTGQAGVIGFPLLKIILLILSALSAFLFASYPGFMLMTVKAIPFWHSFLEPIIFLLQGLLGGVALAIISLRLVPDIYSTGMKLDFQYVITINFILLLVILSLLIISMVVKSIHGGADKEAIDFLIKGKFAYIFIGGVLLLGLLVPLAILIINYFSSLNFAFYIIISILELCGIYLGKYSILKAGIYPSLISEHNLKTT